MVKTCGLIPRYWEEKVRKISETPKLPKIYAYLGKYICIYDIQNEVWFGCYDYSWILLKVSILQNCNLYTAIHCNWNLPIETANIQSFLLYHSISPLSFFLQTLSQTLDLISTTLSIQCHRLYRLVQYSNLCW